VASVSSLCVVADEIQAPGASTHPSWDLAIESSFAALRAWPDQVLCGVCFISPHCCERDQGLWSNKSGLSRLTIEPVGLSAVFAVVSGPSLFAASISSLRFVADEIKAVGGQLIASAMKTFIAIPFGGFISVEVWINRSLEASIPLWRLFISVEALIHLSLETSLVGDIHSSLSISRRDQVGSRSCSVTAVAVYRGPSMR
jgi:hypothetical protein